jgi:dolichol-phosphate mannosyltransferase
MDPTNHKSDHDHLQTSEIVLGIVCPMANESATAVSFVKDVLEQCRSQSFRSVTFFAVLDNKSRDGTLELLRTLASEQKQLQVVWAPENRCAVDAYLRGYAEAVNAGCDWILEIDAGYSHQPSDIPQFFAKMASGYDCVFGSRFCEGGSMQAPVKRRVFSRGGTVLANTLLGTKLKDMTSGFEMFSRRALQEVLARGIHSRGHFFQTEIRTHCRNMAVAEVPIQYRLASESVNGAVLKDAFTNLWRLFRLRTSGRL